MRPLVFESSLTVRTDANLRAAIEAAAAREGASTSEWVRRALASIAPPPPRPAGARPASAAA